MENEKIMISVNFFSSVSSTHFNFFIPEILYCAFPCSRGITTFCFLTNVRLGRRQESHPGGESQPWRITGQGSAMLLRVGVLRVALGTAERKSSSFQGLVRSFSPPSPHSLLDIMKNKYKVAETKENWRGRLHLCNSNIVWHLLKLP